MKSNAETQKIRLYLAFVVALLLCVANWLSVRSVQAEWKNVPEAYSPQQARLMFMGDSQLAYRAIGAMLQNFGNTGGRYVNIGKYDFAKLEAWFDTEYELDATSYYVPFLTAYYFGSTRDPEQARHVINFLRKVGNRPGRENWRWLVHSIFMARHVVKDTDLALELANILAEVDDPDMPNWTRHMKALVMNSRGEKEDAYNVMVTMLQSSADKLSAQEVNYIVWYICEEILSPEEAEEDKLCALHVP